MLQSGSMEQRGISKIFILYGFAVSTLVLIGVSGYLFVSLSNLEAAHAQLIATYQTELNERAIENASTTKWILALETALADTTQLLEETVDEKDDLSEDLHEEKSRNDTFEDQITKIGSTVGTLDKLAKTDKQLLQKYSKVFFLNEHYVPEKIVEIDKKYLYSEDKSKFLHAKVWPFFKDMVADAKSDGVDLWVISAFRSFDEQAQLKGAYSVTYGTGANAFSADQGYSEHQLGTTIDFTTSGINGGLEGFDATPAFVWLQKNAYKYGFILSYPHNNTYYVFEPWHWRFVGTDLAKDLHRDNAFFYDWEQRKIDEYLISLFD